MAGIRAGGAARAVGVEAQWGGDCTCGARFGPVPPGGSWHGLALLEMLTIGDVASAQLPFEADYNQTVSRPAMAKTASTPPAAAAPASYEDALGELDRLVAAMESGQLPLDRLLESYKRGADLLGFCRARLEAVEQQVKVLEDGQLKPWTTA